MDEFHRELRGRAGSCALGVVAPLVAISALCAAPARADAPPRVLVVHAYHPGFEWSDRLHTGFAAALDGADAELHVEYLDLKRLTETLHLDALAAVLATKYRAHRFDAVVAFDDHAVQFVLEHRALLAPGVPVVFGGLNDYDKKALDSVPLLTGVVETADLAGTLNLARLLVPKAKRVVVVSDRTRTSASLAAEFRKLVREPPGRLTFEFVTAESLEGAAAHLKGATDTIGLLLPFNRGRGGRFIEYRDAARHLSSQTDVPLFSCWDFYLGHGIVGGRLTSAGLIGAEVGSRVRRILGGERVERIPILEASPTALFVDDRALRARGLSAQRLPPGTQVIGLPARTMPVDQSIVFGVVAATLVLTLAVLNLSSNVLRRRRAETQLRAHQAVVERALAHESLLAEVAARFNATDDFKVVLDELLASLTERLAVAKISLYSFSEDHRLAAKISSRLSERGRNIQDLDVLSFQPILGVYETLRRRERVVSMDLEDLGAEQRRFYQGRNIHALVILPVQVAGRVKGILGFAQNEAHAWSEEEVTVFETISRIIAASWERYEEMTARIEAESKHADAVHTLEKTTRVAALGVMAAGIAHEIGQPLNAIRIAADGAIRRSRSGWETWPEPATKKLQAISVAALRIEAIVRHVRELWVAPGTAELSTVDLGEAVRRALEIVGRQARNRGIELCFEPNEAPVLVRANQLQLEQIVINLVTNAVQALSGAHCGRHIWVRASVGDACVLSVEDDGPGVAPEDVPRLFEPFFSTKAPGKGSGLGLAIVKNIVQSFEGQVEYFPRSPSGASFRVSLPRLALGRVAV